jgi:tRNA 2-selenouridine synthase
VQLQLPTEARVRLLRDEYAHFEADGPALMRQLDCLVGLHGRERVENWKSLAAAHRWDEMVRRLLEEHYDPAYHRSINRNFQRAGSAVQVSLDSDAEAGFARAAAALAGD